MKNKLHIITLLITTAIYSPAKADSQPAPAAKDNETKQTELKTFANNICDATLKGLKETLKILNLEFGIRLQMDEKQLKESGLTIEEAIKQNEAMINSLADADNQDEIKPDTCKITKITDTPCEEIYKKVTAEGAFGVTVDPKKVTAAAKTMNINNCGLISITASVKETDQPVDFAVAKTNNAWSVIVGFAPAPTTNNEKTSAEQTPPEK